MEDNKTKRGIELYLTIAASLMFAAAVIIVSVVLVKVFKARNKNTTDGLVTESQMVDDTIVYNNKEYTRNKNLHTVLFIGEDAVDESVVPGTSGYAGQADCLMLLIFDKDAKTVKILEISRDAMADIDMYDLMGNYYATVNAQIALQYSYCIGGESSCYATKKSVQRMLGGISIDGYVSLNMKDINNLNDLLGGVSVYISRDYTEIDKSFVEGSTVLLKDGLAERFVRSRDCDIAKSNELRMERQTDYVKGLYERLKELRGESQNFYEDYYEIVSPFVLTDLTADEINEYTSYTFNGEVLKVEGEVIQGEIYEEYHIDEEKLNKMMIDIFYKEM